MSLAPCPLLHAPCPLYQFQESFGNVVEDTSCLVVEALDKWFGSWEEQRSSFRVLHVEQDVYRTVVNTGQDAEWLSIGSVHQLKPDDGSPCGLVVFIGHVAWEEHVAAGEASGLLHIVDVAEFHQGRGVGAKPVFFKKEGYENAVDAQYHIVGIHTVEHIIVHQHGHLALHAMGLADTSYLINVVVANHDGLIFHTLDIGAQLIQTVFDVLVATVYLGDIVDTACAVGTECGNEQGNTGADVGAGHASGS